MEEKIFSEEKFPEEKFSGLKNSFANTPARDEKIRRVLSMRQPTLTIVLENVHDPHNVSAVMRSCDAVGVPEICLVYHSGQKFPEQFGKKTSGSALKWIDKRKFSSIRECYDALRAEGKKIFATHMATDSVSLYELNLTHPVALVVGNEHSGVSDEAVALADGNFLIPQVGMAQSLNISVACAVSLYEALRQRMAAGMYDEPQLTEENFEKYYKDWSMR